MVKAQVILAAALVGSASAFNASPMKMSAAATVSFGGVPTKIRRSFG
jgi:hypothetical protein